MAGNCNNFKDVFITPIDNGNFCLLPCDFTQCVFVTTLEFKRDRPLKNDRKIVHSIKQS